MKKQTLADPSDANLPTRTVRLLNAVKAEKIGSDVGDILAEMQTANEYATTRDENGLSAEDIIVARGVFQVYAGILARHREELNKKRRQTIPDNLFDAATSGLWFHVLSCNYTPSPEHDLAYLLYEAVNKGASVDFINQLIDLTGADVSGTGRDGEPIIYAAVGPDRLAVLQLLVQKGADVHAEGVAHKTILHGLGYYEADPNVEVYLRYLIKELHFDVDARNYNLNTLLHECACHGSSSMFSLVLKYRPDITLENRDGMTCMQLAQQPPTHNPFSPEHRVEAIKQGEILGLIKAHLALLQKRAAIELAVEDEEVVDINLASLDLNNHDLPYVRKVLEKSKPHSIDLSNNKLTGQCEGELVRLVEACPFLVKVNLMSNSLISDVLEKVKEVASPHFRMAKLLVGYKSYDYGERHFDLMSHYLQYPRRAELVAEVEYDGWTVFHFAACFGNEKLIQLAVKEDFLRLTHDGENKNAFHLALDGEHEKLCRDILKRSPNVVVPVEHNLNGIASQSKHPLVSAVEREMVKLVEDILLLELDLSIVDRVNDLLSIAANNQDVGMVELLLRYGFQLTQPEFKALTDELPNTNESATLRRILQESLDVIVGLFGHIKEGDPVHLRKILRLHDVDPNVTLDGETSLLSAALSAKQFDCAGVLIAEGAVRRNPEKNATAALSPKEKIQLRDASLQYFSRAPEAIVGYFESRTRFVGGRRRQREKINSRKLFDWVFDPEMLDLWRLYLLPILEVVEYASNKVDIIFDFTNDNVEGLNPKESSTARGVVLHKEGKIYVAARRDVNGVRGTLMHELCHLAMQLVYGNECNPYEDASEEYTALKEKLCSRQADLHDIIQRAFTKYGQEEHAAELIVRVPHLIAELGQKGECILLDQAPNLLRFYRDVVLPDIRNRINKMKQQSFSLELEEAGLSDLPDVDAAEAVKPKLSQQSLVAQHQKPQGGGAAAEAAPAAATH